MSRYKRRLRQIKPAPYPATARSGKTSRPLHVTADEFRAYLDQFRRSFKETLELIPQAQRARLLRTQYLDSNIIAYVSTQYGAGFEYVPATESFAIEYRLGSRPVDQLLLGTPKRLLKHAATGIALSNGSELTIQNVTFRDINPLRMAGEATSVRLIDVHCEAPSLAWSRDIAYAELYGDRSQDSWTSIRAVERAKNEILLAVLDVGRATRESIDIGAYLAKFKARQILILGDYGQSGKARLEAIAKVVRELGYDPILLSDVPDEPSMDLQQKVVALGSASRFVVIDDSSKSGHLVEAAHVVTNRWITVVLRLAGSDGTYLTHGWSATSKVATERSYTSQNLAEVLREALRWSEDIRSNLVGTYETVYPWRTEQ